jgi:ribonucleotide monophosphatase NagD (HAD superfamily)
MTDLSLLSGILFDLDGVLYVGSRLIDGAIETVTEIKQRGYRCRFISNPYHNPAILQKSKEFIQRRDAACAGAL